MQKIDKKLRKAAQMYEEQFLRQMVRAMRKSVSHSAITKPSFGEKIFREQLDDKYVKGWIDRGGTGFGDMIYGQLVEKFYPQLANKKVKNIRPVNLSDRYQGVSRSLTTSDKSKHTFNIKLGRQEKSQSYLQLPWEGKFEKQFQLPSGEQVAMFSHPFGLESTFVFKGVASPGLLNKTLSQGENFAQLASQEQNMTWQINHANSRKDSSGEENSSFN